MVQYLSWLATYPNDQYQITKEDIELKFGNFEEKVRKRQLFLTTIRNNQNVIYLVARINQCVAGFIYGQKTAESNLLDALYVLPEYQGRGVV